jgi:hypothetical protein
MPREPWQDDPEYLGLWRAARQEPDAGAPHSVIADWLEEKGHNHASWLERLHGLTAEVPAFDPVTGVIEAGEIPLGHGSWAWLLGVSPPEEFVTVFSRGARAYQYLRRYRGRYGWDLGQGDWSSETERAHLLEIPRPEFLACELVGPAGWDWLTSNFPHLHHFRAMSPQVAPGRLARLRRMPGLRGLSIRGQILASLDAMPRFDGLRHLSLQEFAYQADDIAALFPRGLESLHADLVDLGGRVHWPALRSFKMHLGAETYPLQAKELAGLGSYPRLERLAARCDGLTVAAVKALADAPRLREVKLESRSERKLPSLKALAKAPALESLTVEGRLDDGHLADIAAIPGLRTLSLTGVRAGRRGLAALAEVTSLEALQVSGECAGGGPPRSLGELPVLEKLDVRSLKMPPGSARALKSACPPWVECAVPGPEQEEAE